MKKAVILLFFLAYFAQDIKAQCAITETNISSTIVDCEDSVLIDLVGVAGFALDANFNLSAADSGFLDDASAQYDNPYIPSPTNDGYIWLGPGADVPRAVVTIGFDLTSGGLICFDIAYPPQGGSSPIEGMELGEEGVTLQYSIDGGLTWIDIVYMCPNDDAGPNNDGLLPSNPGPATTIPTLTAGTATRWTDWESLCFPIPAGAQTSSTQLQWIQEESSGINFDHWGMDNISIQVADPTYNFYLGSSPTPLADSNSVYVFPNSDSTFNFIYTNGIDDTCTSSVSVQVNPTVVMDDFFICEGVGTGDTLTLTGVAPTSSVIWTPATGLDDPTSQTPFANPPSPGPSQTYTATSACGSDSVTVTFFSVDAVAEKDTVCPNELNQLFANIEGVSTSCDDDYTVFNIPYYKEFGTEIPLVFSQADNGISQILDLPFTFQYYCDPVTQIRVSTNGYIGMSVSSISLSNNLPFPVNILPNNIVALMWDDLIDSTNNSSYFVAGTAPNRKFVVNFDLVHVGGNTLTEPVIGQIILHETTSFIDLICENCQNDVSDPTASQGIENLTGFIGTPVPGRNNTNWEATQSAYRLIPNTSSVNSQTITWTPSANVFGANTSAPIVTPTTTTQYTVEVINDWSGCTYSDSITVFVDQSVTANAGADTSICLGDTLSIPAVSSGTNFEWTAVNGNIIDNTVLNAQVYPDTTTTYTLSASTGTCFDYDTITVGISSFTIDSTELVDEICVANSGSITILASGQTTGLQYSIDNGATFQASNIFPGLSGGNYNIVVGSTNCDTTYTVNIISGAALLSFDSINIQDAICGTPGTIDIYATGGTPPLLFSIDSGLTSSTSSFFPGLIGGTYEIFITDSFDCILDSTVVVGETATLGLNVDSTNDVSCFGETDGAVFLSPTGGQPGFEYSLDNVVFNPSNTFNSLTSGNYTAYVVDSNACTDSVDFTINQPNVLDVQITVPGNVLCAGGTIDSLVSSVTGGTAPFTYLWNTTEITPNIQNIVFGTYDVIVTDANGCQAFDTVLISQPIPLFLSIDNDSVLCGGQSSGTAFIDSISGGVLPYTYSWTGPSGPVVGNDTSANLPAGQYILTVSDFNGCTIADTTTILEPSPVVIGLVPTNLLCNGDTSGCIDATVTGGTAPYTYSWSNGPTTEDQCNLSAGWYVFTITDARGCIYVDSAEITAPNALDLNIAGTNVTCFGLNNGSATATVTGGTPAYNYTWTGSSSTSATASNLTAGTYVLDVVDLNGCSITDSVTITEPTDSILLTIDNVTNVLCNGGNTGSIQVSTAGGTAPYSYAWTGGGGNNEDLNNAAAGTYTLTVTDANGCPISISETITQPTAINITLSATSVTCFGSSTGEIQSTVSGGVGPYTYNWSGPNAFNSSAQNLTGLVAGSYTLNIVDANNCAASQNIVVNEPAVVVIDFNASSVDCFGGNNGSLTAVVATGGTGPFTFQWDAAANNQPTATATGLSAGSYTVTVTDANGCTYTDNASITEPNAPITLILDSTNISCASYDNGIAVVSAQGGTPSYSYLWSDPLGQTTAEATDLAPGTYQVTVTDNNGCTETGSIMIEEPPAINVVAIADSSNCFGDATGSLSILASGGTTLGYAYSIDGGETFQNSPEFFNLPAGVYDEIVVQDLGSNIECLSTPISTTVFEQPFFSFEVAPNDTTLQLEETVNLALVVNSPNYTNADIAQVVWFPTTGLNCSDCIDPTVLSYENYTEYTATVYYLGDDNELCSQLASTIIIVENNLELYVPNAFTPGSFDNINNVFEVYGEGIEYITMQIFNRWGEKVFESANQKVSWDGTFKGEMQSPGVYTYYLSVEYLDGKTAERKGSVTLIR